MSPFLFVYAKELYFVKSVFLAKVILDFYCSKKFLILL
ncbi:hypothetical protein BP951000_0210 [Brachyspira pilosicoli 95/1000]|uniref:Uncharacterized protein n=1 Tax=Brachyspira pilosicoli (strain ATCC BAA-1826 / 95/1000) TaxID=759914 RepID=D8IAN6_BRAP9|nr:hypothetical protein BP951000_0210 [Brachyspira pilosicoli 95/1000]